ncbi:G1/S-specific cyclin-E-like [Panonychus citri]|uniref:G1/S-specific cyclin-E-like n=1 Tax=Panonychus citri TaxID=50023 RepID=UPI0023079E50|nr:G1/S-specific cyclin-E-like [Panonychus citri]
METQPGILTPNVTQSCSSSSRRVRPSPLPTLNMSDSTEMWESMINIKEIYCRDSHLLAKHPNITPRMRSILLDWLSEVSELFKLHRETFYLALDFVDRYLTKKSDLPRQQLQLIGTTCLFIAAKIEEVYPPKSTEFAAVTDGACTDCEIFSQELVIMETLKWSLHPVTVNKWLSIFMQIYSILEKENNRDPEARSTGEKFLIPNYSATFFVQVAHLIDLCMLDIGSLQYNYDVIAASAFYHFTDEETVYSCTRFKHPDIRDCIIWMTPFALAVRETGMIEPKVPANVTNGSWSNMQYHTVDLTLLERAHMKQIDLTEDSSDESVAPSMPPSPLSSSPFNAKSKVPLKVKRDNNNNNNSNNNGPITISSSPIASSSNAQITSSPLPLQSLASSPGLRSTGYSPNPLSTTSSPPQHNQTQSSSLTPSSLVNKKQIQETTTTTITKITTSNTKKRKRDLNNNSNNNNDDYYDDTESEDDEDAHHHHHHHTRHNHVHHCNDKEINNNETEKIEKIETNKIHNTRQSARRITKKRRSYSPPTSSPATF